MLHTISWLQFVSFLFICLGIYYAYVLIRYYRREVLDFVRRGQKTNSELVREGSERLPDENGEQVNKVDQSNSDGKKEVQAGQGQEARPGGKQAEMFAEGRPAANETPEGFRQMEKVIALLQAVSVDWSVTTLRRAELEEEIGKILWANRQLRNTEYEVAINNYLERTCKTRFALTLTEGDLKRLWDQGDVDVSEQQTRGW
jgi:hypothetical protein